MVGPVRGILFNRSHMGLVVLDLRCADHDEHGPGMLMLQIANCSWNMGVRPSPAGYFILGRSEG